MIKYFKIPLTFLLIYSFVIGQSVAQDDVNIVDNSLKDVMLVAATGVGGAVLGLSTLSFVEEPSEHLKNIVIGGALGVIAGVAIVAFKQATKSQKTYGEFASLFKNA